MNDRFLIYGLSDPRTGQLRYIGKSCRGLKRARSHAYPGYLSRDRTYCGNWIRSLQAEGKKYNIVVVQILPDSELLAEAESFWIGYFRRLGAPLTNLTNGGEGCSGRKMSAETREKLRLANIGNKNSTGKPRILSAEQRQAMADRARARAADPKVREKISNTLKGHTQSREQVATRAASLRARWAKNPRKPWSEEIKKKMRDSALKRWERERNHGND